MRFSRRLGLGASAALLAGSGRSEARLVPEQSFVDLSVLMPDDHNLQFMAFWLAMLGGGMAEQGLRPRIVTPERRRLAAKAFAQGAARVAVLPAPLYLSLVADGVPMRIVANLLSREAISLVLRGSLAPELPAPSAPLIERLDALRGRRIGVAGGPVLRLEAMLAAGGMELGDVTVVTLPGRVQNEALARGDVDALFAHTPYLERALVEQGAKLYVHLAKGEVPALTGLMVHAVVAEPSFIERHAPIVEALVAPIARALKSVALPTAPSMLASRFEDRSLEQLTTIIRLLEPALPRTLTPTLEAAQRTQALFPSFDREVAAEEIAAVLEPRFAASSPISPKGVGFSLGAMALGGAAGWVLRRRAQAR